MVKKNVISTKVLCLRSIFIIREILKIGFNIIVNDLISDIPSPALSKPQSSGGDLPPTLWTTGLIQCKI